MKKTYLFLLLTLAACSNEQRRDFSSATTLNKAAEEQKREICWTGRIAENIPVLIHYQQDSDLVVGSITYLNTKAKIPIKLIGNIDDEKNYRLLEFDSSGMITGIITGKVSDQSFSGSWRSPESAKELTIRLQLKDSFITAPRIVAQNGVAYGRYQYMYGADGYQGYLDIEKSNSGKAIFGISSVTSEPARNIAQIEDDTVLIQKNCFYYELPGTSDCGFKVSLYKDFARVQYTKGICEGQFGWNATVEGIFLRIE